jgi:hypothetical protein
MTRRSKKFMVVPLTRDEANAYVKRWHRHHQPSLGGQFHIGAAPTDDPRVVGVCTVGRPVSRHLDDTWTVEVTRLATDGTENCCSFLYGAAWRVAREMGYRRLITYTLPEEGGASLRGAGFHVVGQTREESWHREARPRVDKHPTQMKLRWEIEA